MNLYFFGGTFDPPHLGHLSIIQSCLIKSHQFILVPTRQSPLKDKTPAASAHHRIRMLELLIRKIDQPIIIDDWEIKNLPPNYSIDAIRHFQETYPGSNLFMVIGADQLMRFKNWKNYRAIMDLVNIVAFNRNNFQYKIPKGMQISWLEDFHIEISSTDIRKKIEDGHLPRNELTPEVLEYIQLNNLYSLQK